ncbi:MAG: VanZ family protein [Methanosarcinaceae archaeon]|nr:VanZ family protein [Methanosarcinaceae archaeon]
MQITKFRIFAALSVAYAALIYYLSSLSSINIPIKKYIEIPLAYQVKDFLEQNGLSFIIDFMFYCYYNLDKIQHIVLYFGFGIVLYFTFFNSKEQSLKKYAAIFAIVAGILYGITDEYHQSFVPGRVASTADLFANGMGVTIAQTVILVLIFVKLINRKRKSSTLTDDKG